MTAQGADLRSLVGAGVACALPLLFDVAERLFTRRAVSGKPATEAELVEATRAVVAAVTGPAVLSALTAHARLVLANPTGRAELEQAFDCTEADRVAELARVLVVAATLGPPWASALAAAGGLDMFEAMAIVEQGAAELLADPYWSTALSRGQAALADLEGDALWSALDPRLGPRGGVLATEAADGSDTPQARAWERVPLQAVEQLDESKRRVGYRSLAEVVAAIRGEAWQATRKRQGLTRTEANRAKRRAPLEAAAVAEATVDELEQLVAQDEAEHAAAVLRRTLTASELDVLQLRHAEGLPWRDVAERLSVSERWARELGAAALAKARNALRDLD